MASIDDRIVKMEFDNAQFESGVAQTTTSLGNLKKALQLDDAAASLDNLSKTVGKIDVSGLNNATDTIGSRFSALGTIATGALMKIGSTAASVGAEMLKSLTVQPLIDGFHEYETQMGAIQTIMANTAAAFNDPMGESQEHLDAVNAKLDELNTYADKTIYNFSEMTRNIGTFTAAGVDLDTATSAIEGISNLAAVSGSTSAQASTAMYQLSQAIASGTVKLQDWNSVVNAGMGGKTFQDALIRTARHLKTGVDASIKARGSFRESLRDGWLTSEVLTTTLKQMTLNVDTQEEYNNTVADLVKQGYTQQEADQIASLAKNSQDAATKVRTFSQLIGTVQEELGSGWTQSWQLIIGDFNSATTLWTGVNNVISDFVNKTSDARNAAIKMWADAGGRQAMIDILTRSLAALESQLGPIIQGFASIIPQDLPVQVANLMRQFADWISYFEFLPHAREELYQIGALVGNIFKLIAGPTLTVFTGAIYGLHSILDGLLHVILGIAGGIATLLNNVLQPVILIVQHLANWINILFAKLGDFIGQSVIRRIGDIIETLIHRIENLFAKIFEGNTFLQDLGNALDAADSGFAKFLDAILGVADKGLGALADAITTVINILFDFLEAGVDAFSGFADIVGSSLSTVFDFVKNVGLSIRDAFGPAFQVVGEQIARVWNAIVDSFKSAGNAISPITDRFKSFGDVVKSSLGDAAGIIKNLANSMASFISDAAPKVADFIIDRIIPAVKNFGVIAGDVFGQVASFVTGTVIPAFASFAGEAVKALDNVGNFISSSILPAIVDFAGKAKDTFGNFAKNLSSMQSDTKSQTGKASDYISAFADSVSQSFGIARDSIKPFTDALGRAADTVQSVFGRITSALKSTFGGVADAIKSFNFDDIPGSLARLATAIGDAVFNKIIPAVVNGGAMILQYLGTVIHDIATNLPDLMMNTIIPAIAQGLDVIAQGAITLLNSFLSGLFGDGFGLFTEAYGKELDDATNQAKDATQNKIPDVFSGLGGVFDGIRSTLAGSASGLAGKIQSVIGGIRDAFLNVFGHNWDEIKERIDFVTNQILDVSLAKFIASLGKALADIGGIGKKLASAVNNSAKALNNAMKGLKRLAGAAEIASFGYTIGKIVDAIKTMSEVVKDTNPGQLWTSIGIIAGILVALAGIMILIDKVTAENPVAKAKTLGDGISGVMDALNQVGKGVKLAAIGFSIAMFGWAVKQIAEAFKTLQGMSLGDMAPGLLAFALGLGAFGVAVKVLNSESKNMLMAATSIGILAFSMKVIADTIDQLGTMMTTDFGKFIAGAIAVAAGIAALSYAVVKISNSTGNGTGAIKSAIAVGILSLALRSYADVVQQFSQIPFDQLLVGSLAAAVGMKVLTDSLIEVAQVADKDGNVGKAGAAIVATAGSLKVIADAVSQLAALPMENMAVSMLALCASLQVMADALEQLAPYGGKTLMAAGALLMVSGALMVLAVAVNYLSSVPMANMGASMLVLVGGLAAMTMALEALAPLGGQTLMAAGALLMVSGALMVLSLSIAQLASLDPQGVATGTLALVAALGVMTGALAALSFIGPGVLIAAGALLACAIAMKIAADAIKELSDAIGAFKDVGDAPLNIYNTLNAIAEGLSKGKNAIDKFIAGGAVKETCDGLRQLADTMDVWKDEAMPKAAENIGAVMDGINKGLASGDHGGISKLWSSFADNNVIGGLKDLSGAVGAYKDIGTAPDNIGKVLTAINTNMGNWHISNAGNLSEVATGLGDLGQTITKYNAIHGDTVADNIGKILSAINTNMPGISSIFSGGGADALPSIASGLNSLSGCLDAYGSDTAGKAAGAIGYLLQTIFDHMDGLGDLFAGPAADALPKIATGLQDMSGCLDAFGTDTAGTASENIGKVLTSIYDGVNPLVGLFGGGAADTIAIVAGSLTDLGSALKSYNDMGDANTNIGNVLDTLSTAVFKFINARAGADSIAIVSGSLQTLANAMPGFANADFDGIASGLDKLQQAISGFTTEGAGNINSAATALSDISTQCSNLVGTAQGAADGIGNLAGKFWDLQNNASNAMSIIPNLSGVCDGLEGSLQGTADAIGNLAGKFWDLSSQATPAINAVGSIKGTCDGLEGTLQGTAAAVGNLAGKFYDLNTNANTAFSAISGSFDNMASVISSSMSKSTTAVQTNMAKMVQIISSQGSAAASKGMEMGNKTGQNFAKGISQNGWAVSGAAHHLVSVATSGLNSGAGAARAAGANISNSFASGLWAGVGSARAAATALAAAAQQAIEAKAKIGSPSKVAIWEGNMIGEGLVIGMNDRIKMVEKSSTSMAETALAGVEKAAHNVQGALTSQDYIVPVRPVLTGLELQNGTPFESGFSTMNSYQMGLDAVMEVDNSSSTLTDQVSKLRSDLKRYTEEVKNTRVGNIDFGGVTVNSDEAIYNRSIDLIQDLRRRADMNDGNY